MDKTFIANLNAAGRAAALEEAKQSALDERLKDAEVVLGDVPLVISAWSDPSRCPNCTVPYTDIMLYPESEKQSTVRTTAMIAGNQPRVMIPIDMLENLTEDVKALVFPTVRQYYDGEAKEGVMPLVVVIEDYDTATSNPVVRPLNSNHHEGGVVLCPPIPKNSPAIMLTGVPDVHEEHHPANVFILDSDCEHLRKDAKRGDVFAFNGTFHKCYTFAEKFAAVKRQPDKLIPLPDSDYATAMTFMSSGFDLKENDDDHPMIKFMDDNHVAHMYLLLIGDASFTNNKGEVTSYRKGSFLFVDFEKGFKISEVPFDLFFR